MLSCRHESDFAAEICLWKPNEQMERETRIQRLTEQDVAARNLLPDNPSYSGFLYAFLLAATLLLSILSVVFFR